MFLILLGAPGTGKGTQAKLLSDKFGWAHVSTGDMLRETVAACTDLGKVAKEYMDGGQLVPDSLVTRMLVERISGDGSSGYILDGFPRNLSQAVALDLELASKNKSIDLALNIAVPDAELVHRLGGRWLCRRCGAIYNQISNPPTADGICDRCGGELYRRGDDAPETVLARLQQQKPAADLLSYYRLLGKLTEIDGVQPVQAVTKDLLRAINRRMGER